MVWKLKVRERSSCSWESGDKLAYANVIATDVVSICWYQNSEIHRTDGPAYILAMPISANQIARMEKMESPAQLDKWVRTSPARRMIWYIRNVCIKMKDDIRLTEQFPLIDSRWIRNRIEEEIRRNGLEWRRWLNVAESLNLMDDGLLRLQKQSELLFWL